MASRQLKVAPQKTEAGYRRLEDMKARRYLGDILTTFENDDTC